MRAIAIASINDNPTAAIPDVLDSLGVAQLLRVHLTTVQDLAKRGQLPGRKVGKDYRFLKDAVLHWLSQGKALTDALQRSDR